MAHTNQTPNYELSQFLGTDKPAWLIDYNGDMEKIDLGLKAAKDVADAAKAEADQGALDISAVTLTANAADAKSTAAISNFAEAYDSTLTYTIGSYVTYENLLYRCITPITIPEAFDGTHWLRITVDNELTTIIQDATVNGYTNCGTSTYLTMFSVKSNKYIGTLKTRLILDRDSAVYIAAYSASGTLAILPAGARPSSPLIIPIHGREVNTAEVELAILIGTDGAVTIQNSTNVNYYIMSVEADVTFLL